MHKKRRAIFSFICLFSVHDVFISQRCHYRVLTNLSKYNQKVLEIKFQKSFTKITNNSSQSEKQNTFKI